MTTFKKTNKERRALMNLNTNFKTFIMMTPTRATKDAKWIIRGFISGRRKYNKNVMKQLYDIMFNVRLRRRGCRDSIGVYMNTRSCPYWTDCDGLQELTNSNDYNYKWNNGDKLVSFTNENEVNIEYIDARNGKVRTDLPTNHKCIREAVLIKLVDNEDEIHKAKKNNYRLFYLKRLSHHHYCYNNFKYLNSRIEEESYHTDKGIIVGIKAYQLKHILSLNNVKGRSKMKKNDMWKAFMKLD